MDEKEVVKMRVELLTNMNNGKIGAFENGAYRIELVEMKGKKIADIFYNEVGELVLKLESI